jgi:hypothetical protein
MIAGFLRSVLLMAILGLGFVTAKAALDVIDVSPLMPSEVISDMPLTAQPDQTVPPLEALQATRERPLFAANRRPHAETEAALPAPDVRGLVLIGLMQPAGGTGRALIRSEEAGTATWIGVGDAIGGYTLGEIYPGRVVVERSGRSFEIKIRPTRTAADRN